MSPAKRLSRQRFRALCERCAVRMYIGHEPRREMRRAKRFMIDLVRAYERQGSDEPRHDGWAAFERLARLAR